MPILDSIEIPDKAEFKIGEISKLLDLEPYVLRYWEEEFDRLEPTKTESGQRVYRRDDIETLLKIRKLLYTEEFTIKGAIRQFELAEQGESPHLNPSPSQEPLFDSLDKDAGEELARLEEKNEQLELALQQEKQKRSELQAELKDLRRQLKEARSSNNSEKNGLTPAERKKAMLFINRLQDKITELSHL